MKLIYTGRVFDHDEIAVWDVNLITGVHRVMLSNEEWIWAVDHPTKANKLAEVKSRGRPGGLASQFANPPAG